jgi:signal transduction histidine kinase
VASIALYRHDAIIGALSVATLAQCREFTAEDIELLKAFASQALIAIANAQLFSQVTASRERLTDLSRQLVAAQEAERRAIARELHDEIGQVLTSLKLLIETSRHNDGDESDAKVTTQCLALTQQLIDRVRDLSLNLRPSMLDDLGLLPTLIHHIDRYTSQTGVTVDFRHSGLERRFSIDIETSVYRIVQEGLTNIARHAFVKDAVVRIWCTGEILGVQIEDTGSGFDSEKVFGSGQANGLSGMRERVELLLGQLSIESEIGRGTRLTAELPLVEFVERRKYDRLDFAG